MKKNVIMSLNGKEGKQRKRHSILLIFLNKSDFILIDSVMADIKSFFDCIINFWTIMLFENGISVESGTDIKYK